MPSYQTLDAIADAYVPALALLWLLLVLVALLARRWQLSLMRLGLGAATQAIAYGLMWLDGVLGAWAAAGLDYSTHAAVAFALVAVAGAASRRLVLPAAISLVLYAGLMLYQRYHSVADIVSTLIVAGLPMASIAHRWAARIRVAPGPGRGT